MTERFKAFACEDLLKPGKISPGIFWLKDESLGALIFPSRT